MATPPDEAYDQPQLDENNGKTLEGERMDFGALHKEMRSTARYV